MNTNRQNKPTNKSTSKQASKVLSRAREIRPKVSIVSTKQAQTWSGSVETKRAEGKKKTKTKNKKNKEEKANEANTPRRSRRGMNRLGIRI